MGLILIRHVRSGRTRRFGAPSQTGENMEPSRTTSTRGQAMASRDEVNEVVQDTRLALLAQIKASAEGTKVPSALERLAYAYALTVGAAPVHLPGGPTHVDVSK